MRMAVQPTTARAKTSTRMARIMLSRVLLAAHRALRLLTKPTLRQGGSLLLWNLAPDQRTHGKAKRGTEHDPTDPGPRAPVAALAHPRGEGLGKSTYYNTAHHASLEPIGGWNHRGFLVDERLALLHADWSRG